MIVDEHGYGLHLCLGVISLFAPSMMFNFLLYMVWNCIYAYECLSLTLMFIYRYLSICK